MSLSKLGNMDVGEQDFDHRPGVSIPVFRTKQEPLSTAAKYIVDSENGGSVEN